MTETTASEDSSTASYSRSTANRSTYGELRKEFEETLEILNDEKRELIMKNSAALTEVQKAEKMAWEREQENARLKDELTSMRLALERAGMNGAALHADNDEVNYVQTLQSPKESSFFSAQEDAASPPTGPGSSPYKSDSPYTSGHPYRTRVIHNPTSRSPQIDRAMRVKEENENAFRDKLRSVAASHPPQPDQRPMSRSARPHQYASDRQQNVSIECDTPTVQMAFDAFGVTPRKAASHNNRAGESQSIWNHVRADDTANDGKPECNQS
jgi:hypothetical protein